MQCLFVLYRNSNGQTDLNVFWRPLPIGNIGHSQLFCYICSIKYTITFLNTKGAMCLSHLTSSPIFVNLGRYWWSKEKWLFDGIIFSFSFRSCQKFFRAQYCFYKCKFLQCIVTCRHRGHHTKQNLKNIGSNLALDTLLDHFITQKFCASERSVIFFWLLFTNERHFVVSTVIRTHHL